MKKISKNKIYPLYRIEINEIYLIIRFTNTLYITNKFLYLFQ